MSDIETILEKPFRILGGSLEKAIDQLYRLKDKYFVAGSSLGMSPSDRVMVSGEIDSAVKNLIRADRIFHIALDQEEQTTQGETDD